MTTGRRISIVTIRDENRDKGKVFVLEEMSAYKAERWAARALLALSRAGVSIPDNVQGAGMAGIAVLGLKALGGMPVEDAFLLMDEMFECVKIQPDPGKPEIVRMLMDDDIEEVATRVRLRAEVFSLHTGFSMADAASKLNSAKTSAGF